MRKFGTLTITVLAATLSVATAQPPSERFYQAVRNNDLAALSGLIKSSDVNTKDERGGTPLMYAAAFGSLDAMKLLVTAGSDVNAKNAFDSTPLLMCASDFAKVRFLVEKGAKVNAQSKPGRTAICIRAFAVYAPPGRKAEFNDRIARAAAWLKSAKPRTTEDRNMQLLGLKWAGTERQALNERVKQLAALQRQDGGWAQTPDRASDAYATATTLYTLHELGTAPSDSRYRKGVEYLLRTQLADGSWHVASRSPKFQPYFQSGFPHDHDQWISASATAWATMALSYAASEKPMTAALR